MHEINKPSLHSLQQVLSSVTGLIPNMIELSKDPSDPQVFEVFSELCNTQVYGWTKSRIGGGGAAAQSIHDAIGASVGEAIETYALSMPLQDLLFGTFNELSKKGLELTDPGRWSLFDKSQYSHICFSSFDRNTKVCWVKAESITCRKDILVPACLVPLPYWPSFSQQGEKIIAPVTSNGASCGRSRSEALLKGICEIIERDAFTIMWRNRLPLPRIEIDKESSIYEIFKQKFNKPGLSYNLVYTRLDTNIPSFFGILIDYRMGFPSVVTGGSADPDPEKAALKTLLELAQGLRYRNGLAASSFDPGEKFCNVRDFEQRVMLYGFNDMIETFSFLLKHDKKIPLSSISSVDKGDTKMNLRDCIKMLKLRNLEVLAVDITPADVQTCGLYALRTLIPECETIEADHLVPLLGGSRWRNIPVELGYLSSASDIQSINPYPHPYP